MVITGNQIMIDCSADTSLDVRIQKHQISKAQHVPISQCLFVKASDNEIVEVVSGIVNKGSGETYFLLMENKGSWFHNTFGGKYKCFCDYLGRYETTDIYEFRQHVPFPSRPNNKDIK